MNRRLFLMGSLLALAACATRPGALPGPAPATMGELEPLYGLAADEHGLIITVATFGCAQKADFTFYIDRREGGAGIAFARRRVETCRGPVTRAQIAFTWRELGLTGRDRYFLLNPRR
jgi:hypothetical protein